LDVEKFCNVNVSSILDGERHGVDAYKLALGFVQLRRRNKTFELTELSVKENWRLLHFEPLISNKHQSLFDERKERRVSEFVHQLQLLLDLDDSAFNILVGAWTFDLQEQNLFQLNFT
jgi:hypothetical protein